MSQDNWLDAMTDRLDRLDCREVLMKLGFQPVQDAEWGEVFLRPHPFRRRSEVRGFRVYRDERRPEQTLWHDLDHPDLDGGPAFGRPTELVAYVENMEHALGVLRLSELFEVDPFDEGEDESDRSPVDYAADKALKNALGQPEKRQLLLNWLGAHGVKEHVAVAAIEAGTVGFNDYRNPRVERGQPWHGGDAFCAIARDREDGRVLTVDQLYLDPTETGGQTGRQLGQRQALWCADWRALKHSKRVAVVLGAVDALAALSCPLQGTAVVALMSAWGAGGLDWRFLRGKQVVLAICPGKPREGKGGGYAPGRRAMWDVHEALMALDVPCLGAEMDDWLDDDEEPLASLSAAVLALGAEKVAGCLKRTEPWLITGMPGKAGAGGRPRLMLPAHDFASYWRYRVQPDFTTYIDKFGKKQDEAGNDTEEQGAPQFSSVCGFRVAGISRVSIASPTSMMTGDADLAPQTIYSLSVQVPRSDKLLRRVVADEDLHNVEKWKKLGPIFSAPNFLRMVNILERGANIGARDAINFVGLAWRNGQTVVNEGPDCFFADPQQQCPYHGLTFPSGPRETAAKVVRAYQSTFKGNGVALMLTWALGAHLKAYLGFWPHFVMQADKGVGKDTVLNRLQRSIGMTVFSRQSMQTEFRILTSISSTSHPVGWGELSANKQDLINKAVHNLQEAYQYSHTRRGAELKDFLLCAPVLLAGEDVPVETLQGKVVRNQLTKAQRGALMPEDLPVFPVRQWLQYLAETPKVRVQQLHAECMAELGRACVAPSDDAGAARMLTNYGGVMAAWTLLCDFAGLDPKEGGFVADLTKGMNSHVKESEGDRHPWVWIVDVLLSEIARGTFRYPYAFTTTDDDEDVLAIRTAHVMDHIKREPSLREFWDSLPVKSDRVFKRALLTADVLATTGTPDADGRAVPLTLERTVQGKRVAHMVGLSLKRLQQYGLYATRPVERDTSIEP